MSLRVPLPPIARDLARTPGATLVRLELERHLDGRTVSTRGPVFAAESLPEFVALPRYADTMRIVLVGAFSPVRALYDIQGLIGALDAARALAGLPPLPGRLQARSIGTEDFGFVAYEVATGAIAVESVRPAKEAGHAELACPVG